jgi:hypothetical protein
MAPASRTDSARPSRPAQRAQPVASTHASRAHSTTGSGPTVLSIILVAALLSAAIIIFLPTDLSIRALSLAAPLSFVFRPRRSQREESPAMLDDRDALVGALRSTFPGPQPLPTTEPGRGMLPGQDQMKIKIRRDQVTGITGNVTFTVNFIAELSPEAREAVRRYRFGKTILYYKDPQLDPSINIFRLLWRMVWLRLTRKRWQINVNDLVHGRTIQCKDILEVLDVEERIMGAAKSFAAVLRAASWFGGEEVVAL